MSIVYFLYPKNFIFSIFRLESDCAQEIRQKHDEQLLFDRLHSQLILPDYTNSQSHSRDLDQSHQHHSDSDQSQLSRSSSGDSNKSQSGSDLLDQSQAAIVSQSSSPTAKSASREAFDSCHKVLEEAEAALKVKIAKLKEASSKEKDLIKKIEVI